MSQTTETFHDKLIQHSQALEQLLANPEVIAWLNTASHIGPENSNHMWNLRQTDEGATAFTTQVMFGELLVHQPADDRLAMEVNSQENGRPTYNSRYFIPLGEQTSQSKIESRVKNPEHDSLIPIAQLDYWLTQLITLLTERKVAEAV